MLNRWSKSVPATWMPALASTSPDLSRFAARDGPTRTTEKIGCAAADVAYERELVVRKRRLEVQRRDDGFVLEPHFSETDLLRNGSERRLREIVMLFIIVHEVHGPAQYDALDRRRRV
jgi:hypothetical protein